MRYRISQSANEDIEHIWLYTYENWSIEQADRYFNLIIEEIEHISQNPKSGKEYSHVRKGYYRAQVKSQFIFYKINTKKEEIEIIRVLHQRMNLESRIAD